MALKVSLFESAVDLARGIPSISLNGVSKFVEFSGDYQLLLANGKESVLIPRAKYIIHLDDEETPAIESGEDLTN